jgi:uncharacterized protein (TIGR00106 family)
MIVEFSIIPVDKGERLSPYIAKVVDIVDNSGLNYSINPMGTVVEGDMDEIIELIKRCHLKMREDSKRVITTIKIDDREGVKGAIKNKVKSIEKVLGKELKK